MQQEQHVQQKQPLQHIRRSVHTSRQWDHPSSPQQGQPTLMAAVRMAGR